MGNLLFMPIVIQLILNFKEFNIGLCVFVDEESGNATALFHFGVAEDGEITFDLFYMQFILAHLSG